MASSDSNGMNQHQQPSENTNNHSPNNHRNHHHHYHDEEAGGGPGSAKFGDYESSGDPFDIPQTKNASLETLKRWRVITLQCHCCPFYRFIVLYLFIYISIYICIQHCNILFQCKTFGDLLMHVTKTAFPLSF